MVVISASKFACCPPKTAPAQKNEPNLDEVWSCIVAHAAQQAPPDERDGHHHATAIYQVPHARAAIAHREND
jgi:hypothetical protein